MYYWFSCTAVHLSVIRMNVDYIHVYIIRLDNSPCFPKCMHMLIIKLLFRFPLQLVYGQCFLSIGLTQFQNPYSLELSSSGSYCCCDDSSSTCQDSIDDFSLDTCESDCDTYFALSFSECQDFAPCPLTMITDISANSATTTIVNYNFDLNVSSTAIDSVRV